MSDKEHLLEIMVPAGNPRSFTAALNAGADAIYIGLKQLNARRPAANFSVFQLKHAVKLAHDTSVLVYLALNIDIKSNELATAAAILELCHKTGVDAVIVKDTGLIYLYRMFYQDSFELHLSTQCAITSTMGMQFAGELGAKRVVLARELTLKEVKQINMDSSIETELFVEGSMCFSISGRCMLSSWVGGKSGNRGLCTAPCRVTYTSGGTQDTPFAMKDLSGSQYLEAIAESGVKAVKIEGRLKKPEWVMMVTTLYKHALLAFKDRSGLSLIREKLKQYSARQTGSGHFYGHTDLTGNNSEWDSYIRQNGTAIAHPGFTSEISLTLSINARDFNITLIANQEEYSTMLKIPPPPKKGRAVTLSEIKIRLEHEFRHYPVTSMQIVENDTAMPGRFVQQVISAVKGLITSYEKKLDMLPDLSDAVLKVVTAAENSVERPRLLGDIPTSLLVRIDQVGEVLPVLPDDVSLVIYLDASGTVNLPPGLPGSDRIRFALPAVLFNNETALVEQTVNKLIENGFTSFESNSYGGCTILDRFPVEKHTGTGLAVLNRLAARFFKDRGYRSVFISPEADRSIYHALSREVEIDCNALVFGRTPLFQTRVVHDDFSRSEGYTDSLGVTLLPWKDCSTTVFTAKRPLSLIGRQIRKEKIRLNGLAADLRWFKKPADIVKKLLHDPASTGGTTFNFFRKLT